MSWVGVTKLPLLVWVSATLVVLVAVVATTGGAVRVAASAGTCSPARPHASGSFEETILSDGLTRNYLLHIPATYTGDGAVSLVLNLPLAGGSGQEQADITGLTAKADQEGFIAVMPEPDESNPYWNSTTLVPPDDIAFISELLDEMQVQLCVDDQRVYAMGLSGGAMMSVRLGCSLSDRIAAIAPVAGVYFPPRVLEKAEPPNCPDAGPVPIIAFHDVGDGFVPYLGGTTGLTRQTARSIPGENMPAWADHNGCSSVPNEIEVAESLHLTSYVGCAAGADTQLYTTEGVNHLGWHDDANDLIWEFFVNHPKTESPAVGGVAQLSSLDGASVGSPGSRSGQGSANRGLGGWFLFGLGAGVLAAAISAAVARSGRRRNAGT